MDWNDMRGDGVAVAGTALAALWTWHLWPWLKSKRESAELALAKKLAVEAVRWAQNEWKRVKRRDGVDMVGDALEALALRHARRFATGALKKWTDEDWLGTIRDAYEELYPMPKQAELDELARKADLAVADMLKRTEAALAQFDAQLAKLNRLP